MGLRDVIVSSLMRNQIPFKCVYYDQTRMLYNVCVILIMFFSSLRGYMLLFDRHLYFRSIPR